MKRISILVITALFLAAAAFGQTSPATPGAAPTFADTVVGGGVLWNQYATPQISGDVFFAKLASGNQGIYSYTVFDITSSTNAATHKWTLAYTPSTGMAVYLRQWGAWKIFADGTVGATAAGNASGTSTGFAATGGVFADHDLGKKGWKVLLIARALSLPAANGRASQFQFGANLAWGK